MADGEEQVIEEGFLTKEERFDKAQAKLQHAADLMKESKSAATQSKTLKEQADGAVSEAHRLLVEEKIARPRSDTQLSIPDAPGPEVCPSGDAAVEGEHGWERIRETDGVLLDQCMYCLHERSAKIPEDGVDPAWVYLPYEAATPAEGPAVPEHEIAEAESEGSEEPVAS